MSEHLATVVWHRNDQAFLDNAYSRAHHWRFDGGAEVLGSAAPSVVRAPLSDPAGVDPEEAFVAALASCHMLFFLALAAERKLVVDSYRDDAVGTLGENEYGRYAMVRVVLRPKVRFAQGMTISGEVLTMLHHEAHERCYIANSVRSELAIEQR
jgi:organic hydroperoxide reductase OsmC/OhrA